jgi:hypothetical protein
MASAARVPGGLDDELEFEQSQADMAFKSAVEMAAKYEVKGKKAGLVARIASRLSKTTGGTTQKIDDAYLSGRDLQRIAERANDSLELGLSQLHKRKFKAADKSLSECIMLAQVFETAEILQALLGARGELMLFTAHCSRGYIFDEWKRPADAAAEMALAEQAFEKLPTNVTQEIQHRFIEALCNFAMFASKVPDPKTGLLKAQKAYQLVQNLVPPDSGENRALRARVLNCLAIRESQAGMKEAALLTARSGHELARVQFEKDRRFESDYRAALHTLALRLEENGAVDRARLLLQKASQRPLGIVEGVW